MKLHIISPSGTLFEGEVQRVALPGAKSPFVVLRHHAPLISLLTSGGVGYTLPDGTEGRVEISGGFVEVRNEVVTVCTD